MEIKSERLLLRQITEEDLAAFHVLQSNAEVTKWTKQGPNKSLAQSQQMLDDLMVLVNMMHSYDTRNTPVLILAITVPPSTELIGLIGTFRPREVGFSLHPDCWGRGYATEAVRAFCHWYLQSHPGQQLFAKVNAENEASVRCLGRCGFARASEPERQQAEWGKEDERETWLLRT